MTEPDVCQHTITLVTSHGGVYQLICESTGPHEQHSVAVYRRDPEQFGIAVAARLDGPMETRAERRRGAGRMSAKTLAAIQEVASAAVNRMQPLSRAFLVPWSSNRDRQQRHQHPKLIWKNP